MTGQVHGGPSDAHIGTDRSEHIAHLLADIPLHFHLLQVSDEFHFKIEKTYRSSLTGRDEYV